MMLHVQAAAQLTSPGYFSCMLACVHSLRSISALNAIIGVAQKLGWLKIGLAQNKMGLGSSWNMLTIVSEHNNG